MHLGMFYHHEANYRKAIKFLLNFKDAPEASQPELVCFLGNCYEKLGDYENALKYNDLSIPILKEVGGNRYARALYFRASIFVGQGNLSDALQTCKKSMELYSNHTNEYYESCLHYANLLCEIGQNLKQAQDIYVKIIKECKLISTVGIASQTLGSMYIIDEPALAEELLLKAYSILSKYSNDEQLAVVTHNLAALNYKNNQSDQAREYCQQSLKLQKKFSGKCFGGTIGMLATLYSASDWKRAEKLYKEAIDLSPGYSALKHMVNLISTYIMHQQYEKCVDSIDKWLERENVKLGHIFKASNFSDRITYLYSVKSVDFHILSILYNIQEKRPDLKTVDIFCKLVIQHQAVTLQMMSLQQKAGKENRHLFEELFQISNDISQLSFHNPFSPQLTSLSTKKNNIETQLANLLANHEDLTSLHLHDITSELKQDECILNFIEIAYYNPVCFDDPSNVDTTKLPWKFFSLIITKDSTELIDIGDAEMVTPLLQKFNIDAGIPCRGRVKPKTTDLSQIHNNILLSNCEELAKLYMPIISRLSTDRFKRLFVIPDGILTRVPFGILPLPNSKLVMNDYEVNYLNSARDIAMFRNPVTTVSKSSVVIADPDFNLGGTEDVALPYKRYVLFFNMLIDTVQPSKIPSRRSKCCRTTRRRGCHA